MPWDVKTTQAVVAIVTGTLTIVGVAWKIVWPMMRRIFKLDVVYAAQIAELRSQPPTNVGFQIASTLHDFVPLKDGFPSYSNWSRERPNWPPKAHADNKQFFARIKQSLSGSALIQARRWERTIPQEMDLIGLPDDSDSKLYLTYVRLRWFLIDKCNSDFAALARSVGSDCGEAVKSLESELKSMLAQFPTRILIVSVLNRGRNDATDLKIDITAGGKIYDTTINGQQESNVLERTGTRFSVTFPILQPGYKVDLRIWYRWNAAAFGSRTFSQYDEFPGREGILINYIVISNGRVRRLAKVLHDLQTWRSLETTIGPERGFQQEL
jgi:hypothetical protein